MGIFSWLIVGGLAGWLGSKIMGKDAHMGLMANIVLGIVGAMVGGFLVNIFGGIGVTGFNIWSILVATLGSVVVIWIAQKVAK